MRRPAGHSKICMSISLLSIHPIAITIMESGRSYVVLRDCSIVPWEHYTSSTRVSIGNSDTNKMCTKQPMNVIIPRKTSEYIKKQTTRGSPNTGRANNVDSINILDFLDQTTGSTMLNRRRTRTYYNEGSFNIKMW